MTGLVVGLVDRLEQLHVAAAIAQRDRRTDGRTDAVPLHRRSPLEAGSVNNTAKQV